MTRRWRLSGGLTTRWRRAGRRGGEVAGKREACRCRRRRQPWPCVAIVGRPVPGRVRCGAFLGERQTGWATGRQKGETPAAGAMQRSLPRHRTHPCGVRRCRQSKWRMLRSRTTARSGWWCLEARPISVAAAPCCSAGAHGEAYTRVVEAGGVAEGPCSAGYTAPAHWQRKGWPGSVRQIIVDRARAAGIRSRVFRPLLASGFGAIAGETQRGTGGHAEGRPPGAAGHAGTVHALASGGRWCGRVLSLPAARCGQQRRKTA